MIKFGKNINKTNYGSWSYLLLTRRQEVEAFNVLPLSATELVGLDNTLHNSWRFFSLHSVSTGLWDYLFQPDMTM